jgi:hypothetical protein
MSKRARLSVFLSGFCGQWGKCTIHIWMTYPSGEDPLVDCGVGAVVVDATEGTSRPEVEASEEFLPVRFADCGWSSALVR